MSENAETTRPSLQWTGVCIDCTDAEELAGFYGRLLGWQESLRDGPEWIAMRDPAGGRGLLFQADPAYRPPVWPEQPTGQDKMLHFEIKVDDLDAAVAHAVASGARLAGYQPRDRVRVMVVPFGDRFGVPSGHTVATNPRLCSSTTRRMSSVSRIVTQSR